VRCYGFIYNPRSGDGRRKGELGACREKLRAAGFAVRDYLAARDPAEEARAAVRDGCDVVVACGGDGTVNAVAQAIRGSEAVLAVLPCGTLNHFAKDLGIYSMAEAEQTLLRGPVREIDAGIVNGRLFVNNSGIGIYPVMVLQREKVRKSGIPKWPAFALAFVKTAARMPFMKLRIEADGARMARTTPFLFVGNNVYAIEGKSLGTRPRLDEGVLGVYTARHVGPTGLLRIAIRALLGTIRRDRDFIAFTARKLTVERKGRLHVSLDGEVCRMTGPLEYSIAPGALRVLSPPKR
jgi:diacylglycerol kinase family enzyme